MGYHTMRLLRRLIQDILRVWGFQVTRVDRLHTMDSGLSLIAANHPVGTVVDVGASTGSWSALALRYLPQARFLLIEAQAHHGHEAGMRDLQARTPGLEYVIAAAGPDEGRACFLTSAGEFGGAVAEGDDGTSVPMTTIDGQIRRLGLPGPYLLKLDTHGYEVPILEGAKDTLRQTSVLVIEAYNFSLRDGCLRFPELCLFMEQLGFRCIDLVDPMRRPKDGALWQFDLIFVPCTRPEFSSNVYEA